MISEVSPHPKQCALACATTHPNGGKPGPMSRAGDVDQSQTDQTLEGSAASAVAPPQSRSMAHCLRCDFQWFTRVEHPVKCPHCRSKKWDVPRAEDKLLTRKPRGKSFTSKTAAKAVAVRIARAKEKPPSPAEKEQD